MAAELNRNDDPGPAGDPDIAIEPARDEKILAAWNGLMISALPGRLRLVHWSDTECPLPSP